MSDYTYKVLWFDDEIKTFETDIDIALQNDIKIFGFDNAIDGLTELKQNYKSYDAIIVDGLFHIKANQITEGLNQRAFGEVAKELFKLKNKGIVIPSFIYSGQKSFVKDRNDFVSTFNEVFFAKGRVFDKNKDEDFEELCHTLKREALKQPQTQARLKNPEIFEPFNKKIIEKKYENLLYDMLINLQKKDFRKKNLTVQRDLLEAIFKSLNDPIPCIPNSFFDTRQDSKPNQEWCTMFLEGRNTRDGQSEMHRINKNISKEISSSFRKLKESVNRYSHLSDEQVLKYPFITNAYLIMEILIWLPKFVDQHYKNYI